MSSTAMPLGHRLVVGDSLGMLRCIDKERPDEWGKAAEVSRHGDMDKTKAIGCIATYSADWSLRDQTWCASGNALGTVDVHHGPLMQLRTVIPASDHGSSDVSRISDVQWLRKSDGPLMLVSSHAAGVVRMHKCTDDSSPETSFSESHTIRTGTSIDCCAVSADQSLLAVGGEGCELSTWNVATGQLANKLKCGKPNPQTRLVDLPWVSCMAWMPGSNDRCVVTGTGYHKLRLYDVESQRRPIFEVDWLDARITAVAPQPCGHYVWAANAKGHIQVLDMRTRKVMDSLKGQIAGSIRDLAMHPTEPLLCSVGLDRWMRVHDTKTKKCLTKVYMKSQLTACNWLPGPIPKIQEVVEPGENEGGSTKRKAQEGGSGKKKKGKQSKD